MRVLTEDVSSSTGATGARTIEDFGPLGEILKRDATGYQEHPNEAQPHNDQWVEEHFTYDHWGRLKTQSRPHVVETSEPQGEVDFYYDGTGQLIEERYPAASGVRTSVYHAIATRNTWLDDPEMLFSGKGVIVDFVSPRAEKAEDIDAVFARGSVRLSDPDGLTVTTRDAMDTLTDYTYGPFRQLKKVDVGRDQGVETFIEYYPYGRKMRHTDPDTGVETYDIYNAFDELEQMTDARGVRKEYRYDLLGRMFEAFAFVNGLPEADERTFWDYDGVDGQATLPNEMGRLVKVSSGSGADPNRHETRYHYQVGNVGLLAGVDRKIGTETFATAFTYDDFNRVESVHYPSAAGAFAVYRDYDARGNLIKVWDGITTNSPYWQVKDTSQGYRIANEKFGNNATTRTVYEPFTGRLSSLRTDIPTSPQPTTLQGFDYTYWPNGNLLNRYNTTTGRNETFRYDDLDRLRWIKRNTENEVEVAAYSMHGNIQTKVDVGTYNYVHPSGGPVHAPRTVTNGTATRTFFYDPSGNEIQRTGGPEGTRTTELYTSFNLPTVIRDTSPAPVTTTFEYDGDHTRVISREQTQIGDRETVYVGGIYERVVTVRPAVS